jgi:hypothetical protein
MINKFLKCALPLNAGEAGGDWARSEEVGGEDGGEAGGEGQAGQDQGGANTREEQHTAGKNFISIVRRR